MVSIAVIDNLKIGVILISKEEQRSKSLVVSHNIVLGSPILDCFSIYCDREAALE